MELSYTEDEIWEAWNDICDNQHDAESSSYMLIKKVLEKIMVNKNG